MSKRCFKCLRELPIEEFYRHRMMADGRLSKCKDCSRNDAKANRLANIDRVRAYDRARAKTPERAAYGLIHHAMWKAAHPERSKAQSAAGNALRDGKLTKPVECEGCGRSDVRIEKHHPDYSKPLLVVWFCKPCHSIADKIRRRLEAS